MDLDNEKPYGWLECLFDERGTDRYRITTDKFAEEFIHSKKSQEIIDIVNRKPLVYFPEKIGRGTWITYNEKNIKFLTFPTIKSVLEGDGRHANEIRKYLERQNELEKIKREIVPEIIDRYASLDSPRRSLREIVCRTPLKMSRRR